MKSSALLIANPKAGKNAREKIALAQRLLLQSGIETELYLTTKRGDAQERSKEGVREQRQMIITAGGDGTINEVINGLAGSVIPLGIIPLGTTNVLALEIGAVSIETAVNNIVMSQQSPKSPKNISLGRINIEGSKPLYFILMAGIGYDGKTVYGINERIKGIYGKGAYILSGIYEFFSPQVELSFTVDGTRYNGYNGIISNVSLYGGRFKIAPDANIEDPYLYINIFSKRGRINLLRYLYGIISGKHTNYSDVKYLRCKEINIEGKAHIQIDGDYLGKGNCFIKVIPNALKLIYTAPIEK